MRRQSLERGFTYLAVLFAVALAGLGLAAAASFWSTDLRREREEQLIFIGLEFRKAIALYYYRTPGQVKQYPASLDELLQDPRYPGAQRYLRKIYRDPITGSAQWGIVRTPDGRVQGIHSLSDETPMKRTGFPAVLQDLEHKARYTDWVFVFTPIEATGSRPGKQ